VFFLIDGDESLRHADGDWAYGVALFFVRPRNGDLIILIGSFSKAVGAEGVSKNHVAGEEAL